MAINIERAPFVTTAAINRPEAMNAINFDVMSRLENLLDELESDDDCRLFVLTGIGSSFISGGDLREFHTITSADEAKAMSERMVSILTRIRNLTCWTLAAVNGHTYGGGWEIMLSFDFRVAAKSAHFGFTQGRFYLPPGWGGIGALFDAVGRSTGLYWLASQRVINSETALKNGLIQDVFEDEEFQSQLNALKKRLALNDRTFIEHLKQPDPDIDDEIEPFSQFWEDKEHTKRVEQFLNRKK